MRHTGFISACLAGAVALSACAPKADDSVERAFQDVNVIDESNLNDVMLTVADPNEAVAHFRTTLKGAPDRIDLQRGLAISLVRAKRFTEAVPAWRRTLTLEGASDEDRLGLADALIRTNSWTDAKEVLDSIPPTLETYQRYRLEAVVADANKDWKKADSFYEIATGLTTRPAKVMNNWGYSKLARGDFAAAERLFGEAIRQDQSLFTAKNNLVLARGAQRNYTLPVVPMSQREQAELLHTLALTAVKQGDVKKGESLLRDAVATHPQYFEAAAKALEALENS
ncbi:lipoprotein, putative [Roseobacter sp. SK209-2-6]|uniref:tetratricopeptide repeat protein n=1 Tax=Roseobacter sp. SK209-2-6 TaxID=388739 RepID=UPI0000F3C71A|nr:tetratricopeptide repeat protein [Roseobacter sp. SK209-2-6]EBA18535.1 lipoprotein, putative [Roseobacter sp. SK209-2-6]